MCYLIRCIDKFLKYFPLVDQSEVLIVLLNIKRLNNIWLGKKCYDNGWKNGCSVENNLVKKIEDILIPKIGKSN